MKPTKNYVANMPDQYVALQLCHSDTHTERRSPLWRKYDRYAPRSTLLHSAHMLWLQ